MDPVTAVILLVASSVGIFVARRSVQRRIQNKKEEALLQKLYALRAGVWIRQTNGNEHPIQNFIEQELGRQGMVLFNLHRQPAEKLLKDGEWNDTIAASRIDFAIIGRIIVEPWERSWYEYPFRRTFEEDSAFEKRREDEKVLRKSKYHKLTLNVRFYGPDGTIHGGCTASGFSEKNDPCEELAYQLALSLAEAGTRTLEARQRSTALAELTAP